MKLTSMTCPVFVFVSCDSELVGDFDGVHLRTCDVCEVVISFVAG